MGGRLKKTFNFPQCPQEPTSYVTNMVDLVRVCSCPKLEWLTELRICAGASDLSDIMLIPQIHNLCSLSLAVEETRWETSLSRVIRSWGVESEQGRGFQHLRSIFLDDTASRKDACALEPFESFARLDNLSIWTSDRSSWHGALWSTPANSAESVTSFVPATAITLTGL